MDEQGSGGRLGFMDTARGAAALWVTLFHLNAVEPFAPSAYQTFVAHGWLGVEVFFVVSGVAIQGASAREPELRLFAWRRFWRIYPPYLASLLLIVIVLVARKVATGVNDLAVAPHGLAGWLAHLAVATAPATSVAGVNWVYWTLPIEIAFYGVVALTVALPQLRSAVLVGVSLLACVLGHRAGAYAYFLPHWCFFALGVAIADLRAGRRSRAVILTLISLADLALNQRLDAALAGLATFALCGLSITSLGQGLNRRNPLTVVGDWSYSLYLVHVPIGCWVLLRLMKWTFGEGARSAGLWQHVTADGLVLGLTCVGAWAFSLVFEKPAMKVARGGWPGHWPMALRQATANDAKPQ